MANKTTVDVSRSVLSDIILYNKYARHDQDKGRRETFNEVVDRNKNMHIKKFPDLKEEIEEAYKYVYEKKILPSMRSMQFAGKPVEISPARIYNCSFLPMDHPDAFSEVMFLLLAGCGVGYSVQIHHVDQLPEIIKPKKTRRYLVTDSIEGWADAVKVLIKAYMGSRSSLPLFDFSDVRPKGAPLKTSGGKAPGPEPLNKCLHNIQLILDRKETGEKLTTLEVHDINCHIADAVLSGGIRRSAMIALFSFTDNFMMSCKFSTDLENNPQRHRANNSAVILRHKITKEVFLEFWDKVKNSRTGEPGFFFTNDKEWGLNPCGEISLRAHQFCNLVTINASNIEDQFDFNMRAKYASFIATLQASYTDFHYLRDVWREQTEKEALIGVSMTGIASGAVLELDMKEAAKTVVEENKRVAELLEINPAARCTTVKPEGTSSLLLGCSSGIHAWHSEHYLRRLRFNKSEPIFSFLQKYLPEYLEDDYWKPETDAVFGLPVKAIEGAITRGETALQFLNRVKKVYKNWVEPGHISGHNMNNVSATVTIKPNEWERVGEWMWTNRDNYTAISVLPYDDHDYVQAPFEEIDGKTYNELYKGVSLVDFTKLKEDSDNTSLQENLACHGGACEI